MPKTARKRPAKASAKAGPAATQTVPASQPGFEFSLVFTGPTELTDELVDLLYEAGCDDGLIGMQSGEFFIDFHRRAPSYRIALMSAIADLERAGLGLELTRVEPI